MNDQFSGKPEDDAQPTVPHMPRVPSADDMDPTRPGMLPGDIPMDEDSAATMPHGIPSVQVPSQNPPPSYGSGYDTNYYNDRIARDRDRKRRMRSRKRRGGEWAWVIVAIAVIGITVIASASMFAILRSSRDDTPTAEANGGMVAARSTAVVIVPTAVPGAVTLAPGEPTQAPPVIVDNPLPVVQPWDGQERFTILVMGWDRRPNDPADQAYRTDTMMLVSLDPRTDRVGILSIPRDLYVTIPGYNQLQRVNSAYVLGELQQPGYGPELAMQTVMYNLGIRVHDYVIVDFNAFTTLVDAIGGIDINVPYNISDPHYPDMNFGYDPFYITVGEQHLDGETALKYARTRHGSSDFRRAERQQAVMMAIRDKVLNLTNLPQLLLSAPNIWAGIQDNVRTGLTFDQMMQLAWYAKDVPIDNIQSGVIDENYISFYTTPQGASVVIPNRYAIGPLMLQVFGEGYDE